MEVAGLRRRATCICLLATLRVAAVRVRVMSGLLLAIDPSYELGGLVVGVLMAADNLHLNAHLRG